MATTKTITLKTNRTGNLEGDTSTLNMAMSGHQALPAYTPPSFPPEREKQVKAFTAAELRAMLAEIEPNGVPLDPTMGLPIAPTDPAEMAAKAALPPPEGRKQGAAPQLPPAVHGSFSLNGIPLIAPGVDLTANINPATNLPYVQVGISPKTIISPPPSRYFDGR